MSSRGDPRLPVLVGIGTCSQREDDFARAREPLDLMLEAVRLAGIDAGGAHTLAGVGRIAVPKGRWRYRNPAGEIARAIGAPSATTVLASVGVLQQSLIGDACSRIAADEIDAAMVVGGDAGHRLLRAKIAGQRAGERQQEAQPDVSLEPEDDLRHPAEVRAGIDLPVPLYAILESAWRAKWGWAVDDHRDRLSAMLERFSEIAVDNPDAWRRTRVSAAEVREPSQRNPLQAFPYTRHHCSNWSVDQAAALLLCAAGKAEALGIPRARWVYPWASTESSHMVAVSARADLSACDGARLAGRAALAEGGIEDPSQLDLVELYSCFPIAVEVYAHELGLPLTRDLTVTGGMPFAGGPYNNYVLQATCRMARLIREGKGRNGLVSSVSGILTKQGYGLWAKEASSAGFVFNDVSAETARLQAIKAVADGYRGPARVAGFTVVHEKSSPRALVLADTPDGRRTLASSTDPTVTRRMQADECCGAAISIDSDVFTMA